MQIQSIPMVYAFFNGQVVDGFQGNIPESQVLEFIQKVSDLSGPSPEIKESLEKLELSLTNSNWEEGLHLSNIILDNDQNNIDACSGKTLSLIGLNKFKEAKDFISILPEEILNDNKIKVLSSKIEVAEKSFEASKNFGHLEKALKDNPKDIKAHIDLSDAFFGIGKISECYQLLIEAIKIDPKWNDQEARKKLISFINSHDLNSEEARKARRQLSSILFN
jgi:putative thioredoxin